MAPAENFENGHSSTQLEEVHHNYTVCIHPLDTQGSILISVQLQGSENYSLWSKSLKIVLTERNKLGFVLGTCRKEKFDSNLYELWDRCNAIVLACIMNTVSKDLVSTVIYENDAHSVWENLREIFDKVNAFRAFFLHREITTFTQGIFSISMYFSRLRVMG